MFALPVTEFPERYDDEFVSVPSIGIRIRSAGSAVCRDDGFRRQRSLFAPSARQTNMQAPAPVAKRRTIPPDQLDSLVAPIALYPDPLLAQTLAASTYPLEVLQLQQWLTKNPGLKDKALLDAVERQPWDPSVQALAALPDVVTWLANDIQWTTDLGNAFLAQQADVMHAVQRMRQKAQAKGNLTSTPQQTVETQVVDSQPVIVIEQANPEVVYVPSYNPSFVYGAPVYPYPPISYPNYSWVPGAGALAFGTGVALGAAWGGGWGGWGWGANWGNADININRNNAFVRNANISATGNRWQHNAAHRGGTPYRDQATANRFGGTARGDSLAARQAGARQQVSRQVATCAAAPPAQLAPATALLHQDWASAQVKAASAIAQARVASACARAKVTLAVARARVTLAIVQASFRARVAVAWAKGTLAIDQVSFQARAVPAVARAKAGSALAQARAA